MIIKPVLSEKSFALAALDRYTFKVDPKATKNQIRQAIEKLFKVDVVHITTSKVATRTVRSRTRHYVKERGYKKAMAKLKPGQKISFFNT